MKTYHVTKRFSRPGIDLAQDSRVADCCEFGNEPSGLIKSREFLNHLRTSWLLRKDPAPWRSCMYVLGIIATVNSSQARCMYE